MHSNYSSDERNYRIERLVWVRTEASKWLRLAYPQDMKLAHQRLDKGETESWRRTTMTHDVRAAEVALVAILEHRDLVPHQTEQRRI